MSEMELETWDPPNTIGETAQLLISLSERKAALRSFCEKDLHQRIAAVENHLLDQMVEAGVESVKSAGTTFYKQRVQDVSWAGTGKTEKDGSRAALMNLLQLISSADERSGIEQAFCDLLKVTVDVRSIGTLVREMLEQGEEIPDSIMGHLQVKDRVSVGKRKSG